jgi:pimeloyl-ACP methyl ester carboxylesterase
METLNERGNTYVAQSAKTAPHVLNFPVEILRDGRTLERPANYALVRIVPPNDVTIDPMKPPIVVVDPRAGHGPGIGGMKPESEIGVALRAGHPVYFIGFLPKPEPGQTIEDVCHAEGTFIEDVAQRHAEAEGKPIVIANCQAGWQTMMMAAIRPDLTGPIILAGSPLSYWAGVRGKNPMRYLGGLLGGTWLTELSGDLGAGIFDGAHLVANFESLNPANTYWTTADEGEGLSDHNATSAASSMNVSSPVKRDWAPRPVSTCQSSVFSSQSRARRPSCASEPKRRESAEDWPGKAGADAGPAAYRWCVAADRAGESAQSVTHAARSDGFSVPAISEMPANNLSVVFYRI